MTQREDEEERLCLQISNQMLPFEQKQCPECGGEGQVPVGNVRGVMLPCRPCGGTGLLQGDSTKLIEKFVNKDMSEKLKHHPMSREQASWEVLSMLRIFMGDLKEKGRITGFRVDRTNDHVDVQYWAHGFGRQGRQIRVTFGTAK